MLSESQFQEQVVELARVAGWRTMHVRRTIGKGRRWTTGTSVAGWPDLAIWRPGRFILAELKTDTGAVTADQRYVIDGLRAAGVDVRVWRPTNWDEIEATLTDRCDCTYAAAQPHPRAGCKYARDDHQDDHPPERRHA